MSDNFDPTRRIRQRRGIPQPYGGYIYFNDLPEEQQKAILANRPKKVELTEEQKAKIKEFAEKAKKERENRPRTQIISIEEMEKLYPQRRLIPPVSRKPRAQPIKQTIAEFNKQIRQEHDKEEAKRKELAKAEKQMIIDELLMESMMNEPPQAANRVYKKKHWPKRSPAARSPAYAPPSPAYAPESPAYQPSSPAYNRSPRRFF